MMTGWRPRSRRFRSIWLVPVLAFIALSAWALASPLGASPDDDFHLASIWCANDARTDLCLPGSESNVRVVPPQLRTVSCFVADPEESAACQQRWEDSTAPSSPSTRGNFRGVYPPVYYTAMNAFATPDIQTSAVVMRLVNVAIFVVMTTLLALLLPLPLRWPLIGAWAITMVPLTAMLLASNNPGAWGIIGVGSAWFAALGWFRASGCRAIGLAVLTVLGVLLAAGARADAAFYSILGLGVAAFLSFEPRRRYWLRLILPAVLVIVAFLFFSASGQSAVAEQGFTGGEIEGKETRDPLSVLFYNVVTVPWLWSGVFGSWGLSWLIESWPGFHLVEFAAAATFIGVVFVGLGVASARKVIMLGCALAALYVIPLYVTTVAGNVIGENVQPRYIVPLVVLLAGIALLPTARTGVRLRAVQVVPVVILLAGANAVALYTNLRRYITGIDVQQLDLGTAMEWWWPGLGVGPMVVWVVGSLAFAAAVGILGVRYLRSREALVAPYEFVDVTGRSAR